MNTDVAALIFVILSFGLIMVRLDRPAKRLDAIYAQIMRELVQDPLRKEEILNEWIASQTEAAKDTRRFWMFWTFIGVVILLWLVTGQTHALQ
jgi:hypothetical protein